MRILFKLIIIVIIIAIAGLIALPFIVDPNDYKQEISDQVATNIAVAKDLPDSINSIDDTILQKAIICSVS